MGGRQGAKQKRAINVRGGGFSTGRAEGHLADTLARIADQSINKVDELLRWPWAASQADAHVF